MSTPDQAYKSSDSPIAERIKAAMGRRRVGLRGLSDAAEIKYRTLQNYLLGTSSIPSSALGRIAQALDISSDWLISGREPNIDKDSLALVLDYFDEFVRPQIDSGGAAAGAEAFAELYKRIYIHHNRVPGVAIEFTRVKKARGSEPNGENGQGPQ